MSDRPDAATAALTVLHAGYAGPDGVASSVVYIEDGDRRIVVDPGMVASPAKILDPLHDAGATPEDITDVVLSHHHPDHTMHAGLFTRARVHDVWAVYHGDVWESRPAEGASPTPSVRLIETPGHSPQDITTLVGTADGVVACTHVWWMEGGPDIDPRATDQDALERSRERVLALADVIVPGHGPPFRP